MTNERNTFQKSLVYKTVCALHHHPTAIEIYEELHKAHPSVSRATVYRILGALSAQHKILKIELPNGADCFDFNIAVHDHFLCRECKRISDIDHPTPKIALPPATPDYDIESYSLLYHGICASCKQKEAFQ